MKKLNYLIIGYAVFLMACGGNHEENLETEEAVVEAPAKSSESVAETDFGKNLEGIYGDYLKLKEAFVQSDTSKARILAIELRKKVAEVDTAQGQSKVWAFTQISIEDALDSLMSEKDIEGQRKHFASISEKLYNALSSQGIKGKVIYKQHCPMAFDNKGANWLSDKPTIANPYFGDQMMECGEVKEVLKN